MGRGTSPVRLIVRQGDGPKDWSLKHRLSTRPTAVWILQQFGNPPPDESIRLDHDAVDQFSYSGDIVDQPCNHAATPCARLRLAVHHHTRIDAADIEDRKSTRLNSSH